MCVYLCVCVCVCACFIPGIIGPLLAKGGRAARPAGSADAGFPSAGVKEKAWEDGAGVSTAENLEKVSTGKYPLLQKVLAGLTAEEEKVRAVH